MRLSFKYDEARGRPLGSGQRSGLSGLLTSLLVLCAGIMHRTLLLLNTLEVAVGFLIVLFFIVHNYLTASQVALVVKNLPSSVGDIRDVGSIPELGRFPGKGNGNSLQYSCLENPMDREAWQATVHGVAKSWTQLSN